jgi:rubrerythrin
MPGKTIKTAGQLLSIARAAESEAVRSYSLLAAHMKECGNAETAALFERMYHEEQKHEHLLDEWAELEGIQLDTGIDPVVWEDPQVATHYDDEATDPYSSTPYKALAFAVHNEERMFRYYTHVAANTDNDAIRRYAEILAREELAHSSILREQRRRAYHAERAEPRRQAQLSGKQVHTLADLLGAAVHMEARLADFMEHAGDEAGLRQAALATREVAATCAQTLIRAGKPGAEIKLAIAGIGPIDVPAGGEPQQQRHAIERLVVESERAFAFYDEVVETADDEAVMLEAQRLTEAALERLAVVQHCLDQMTGALTQKALYQ